MLNLQDTQEKFQKWSLTYSHDLWSTKSNGGVCQNTALTDDNTVVPNCIIGTFLVNTGLADIGLFFDRYSDGTVWLKPINNDTIAAVNGLLDLFTDRAVAWLSFIQATADNNGRGNVPWNVAVDNGKRRFADHERSLGEYPED